MRTVVISFQFLLCIFCVTAVEAATESPVTLEGVLRNVWEHSPQLEGQEVQASLASGDRWRRFVFNEPQFLYSNSDDNTARTYGLSLTTSFPGKGFAFARLDAAKSRGQHAELLAKKYDLTKTVTQAYLDCAVAQETFDLQKQTSADLETVFQTLKALYETGHSTQAEKIGSELLARQAKLDLTTAGDKQEVLCKKLDLIIPTAVSSQKYLFEFSGKKARLPDDLDPGIISELGPMTADQNRAVSAVDLSVATAFTSGWSQLPDLTFNFNRNHYTYLPGSPSGKEWTTTYGVSVTLPILFPFHETVEAKRTRSQALIDQNSAEIQKVSALSDRADGAKEYQRSMERLQELRSKDLALAEALVESTYSAYRAGKLGYAELVLSRKTLTEIRTQDIQLRSSIVNSHLKCLDQCTSLASQIESHP